MVQVIPANLVAPARPGLTLGYQLLNPNLSEYQAFTTTGVSELSAGNYLISSGVTAPDSGGYIRWAVSAAGALGEVLAVGVILPSPLLSTDTRLNNLDRAISTRQPRLGWPP